MGNASSSWHKADRVIDSLISGLDLEGIVFSAEGAPAKDSDSLKGLLQYFVHRAIEVRGSLAVYP
ncbi:hypothetical protein EON65_57525 [archaeon]|nr:MAG: hypothetical protein EON65_57525 [archaeon]